jgi:hypothetical protein
MITLVWPGGEHTFALRLGELRALQGACDAGPEQILNRIIAGVWRVDDIVETVRLGLIGGGMPDGEARKLVRRMTEGEGRRGLLAYRQIALQIIMASIAADPDDPLGERTGASAAPPQNGDSAASTAREQSSD